MAHVHMLPSHLKPTLPTLPSLSHLPHAHLHTTPKSATHTIVIPPSPPACTLSNKKMRKCRQRRLSLHHAKVPFPTFARNPDMHPPAPIFFLFFSLTSFSYAGLACWCCCARDRSRVCLGVRGEERVWWGGVGWGWGRNKVGPWVRGQGKV